MAWLRSAIGRNPAGRRAVSHNPVVNLPRRRIAIRSMRGATVLVIDEIDAIRIESRTDASHCVVVERRSYRAGERGPEIVHEFGSQAEAEAVVDAALRCSQGAGTGKWLRFFGMVAGIWFVLWLLFGGSPAAAPQAAGIAPGGWIPPLAAYDADLAGPTAAPAPAAVRPPPPPTRTDLTVDGLKCIQPPSLTPSQAAQAR